MMRICASSLAWRDVSRCEETTSLHGGAFSNPDVIVQLTSKAMIEFSLANDKGMQPKPSLQDVNVTRWRAPELGWVQMNCDAALDRQLGRMGLGMVVRDSQGCMLAAKGVVRDGCLAGLRQQLLRH
jgi:hypothetical protein